MVKKILIVLVLLPFLVLAFAPKKELFFLLQKRLATQGIVISDGAIHENPFGLRIEHPSVYFKGIKVADIDNITLWTVLGYTRGSIDSIVFDSSLKSFLPPKIKDLAFTHHVIKPTQVSLTVNDEEYQGSGTAELKGRTAHFHFTKIPQKSPIMVYLKSNEGGWDYEQRF